uniref:Similar to CG10527 n=1 Tax=Papilio xuthus TaxID=66420 RepID=I4DJQ6_PAPXU|nr:similar to CG10527 [Papilio xuthus]
MANVMDVSTPDNLQYQFFPVSSGVVQFKVRTPNDAHVALTMGPQDSEPIYEIMIGGWGNTKSVIRKNKAKPDKVEIETPGIVNGGEFRGFWVRWDGGVVSAGREGESIPFISWADPEPFPVGFVGVCTGCVDGREQWAGGAGRRSRRTGLLRRATVRGARPARGRHAARQTGLISRLRLRPLGRSGTRQRRISAPCGWF